MCSKIRGIIIFLSIYTCFTDHSGKYCQIVIFDNEFDKLWLKLVIIKLLWENLKRSSSIRALVFAKDELIENTFYHTTVAEDIFDYWKRPNQLEFSTDELKQVFKQKIIMFCKYCECNFPTSELVFSISIYVFSNLR